MDNTESLKQLGISKNASRVYLASLSCGISQVKDLSRETGLVRQLVYEAINELVHKGLMIKEPFGKNRFRYIPISPNALLDLVKDQEQLVKQLLPDLEKMYNTNKSLPKFRIYENKMACRQMLKEQLRLFQTVPEMYVISTVDIWYNLNPSFVDSFWEQKAKTNIRTKLLVSKDNYVAQHLAKKEKYEVRLLPKDNNFFGNMIVCGDSVMITSIDKYDIHAITITSKPIAKMQKELFFSIWNRAKLITN